jgi:circadian clock protein KaiB
VKSCSALENIRKICQDHLEGNCQIEVIDLVKHPEIAMQDQILAVPTLVYLQQGQRQMFVGDLSAKQKVLDALHLSHLG